MLKKLNFSSLATLGYTGYCYAPGSVASLITLPVIIVCRFYCSLFWYTCFSLCVIAFSSFIIYKSLPFFKTTDPREIVLDEVAGCFVAYFFTPITIPYCVTTFFLFRWYDIIKPFGIRHIEKLPDAYGVILDDIIAGIATCLTILFLITFQRYYVLPL
ncbi:MAG: phosphatidylglycerophosphatase A [Candidatus Babeliales bacterium]